MLWVHCICQLFSINHVAGRPPGDVYICCMWANSKRSNLAHVQDIPKICYSSCCAVVWYIDRGYLTNCYIFSAWWRHQMDIFSALLAVCTGNSPVTGEFPAKRPVTRSFDIFFICAWINGWVNNGEAGDLRRYRVHYDVIVIRLL